MNASWSILNESIVSNLIGGIISGVSVGLMLFWYQKKQTKSEAIKKLKEILGNQIRDNLQVCGTVIAVVQEGGIHIFPSPFKTSAIQVFLQTGLIDKIQIETSNLILELYDRLLLTNHFNDELIDYTVGLKAAMTNNENVKTGILEFLKTTLPYLEKDLAKLKELLEMS